MGNLINNKDTIDEELSMFQILDQQISFLATNHFCPSCYKQIATFDPNTLAPKCICGWIGSIESLLSKEEALNKNRNLIIDKILE